jgi:E3 ubiquitin-protein ligase HERC2
MDKIIFVLILLQVQALKAHKIVHVALGSGDAHTLCVDENGFVYSFGDGDFGKLGNGSTNGVSTYCIGKAKHKLNSNNYSPSSNQSSLPQKIECLENICKVYSGSQFSAALTRTGIVYTWGKGYGGRLGKYPSKFEICLKYL